MTEKQLVFEDFKDRVGSVFTPLNIDVALSLTLHEAELLTAQFAPPEMRPPFSLIFLGPGNLIMPQGLYLLRHDEMGEVTIFLVPVGKDERGVSYQATFN